MCLATCPDIYVVVFLTQDGATKGNEMSDHFKRESVSPQRWQVFCPECGGSSIDRVSTETGEIASKDQFSVAIHPDNDEYESPLETRGGYVSIELSCGRGHGFKFVIGNHKGIELFGLV